MRKLLLLFFFLTMVVGSVCGQTKFAVYMIKGCDESVDNNVQNEITNRLIDSGKYQLVETFTITDLSKMVDVFNNNTSWIMELMRQSGVAQLCVITNSCSDNYIKIDVKMTDVKSGRVVKSGKAEGHYNGFAGIDKIVNSALSNIVSTPHHHDNMLKPCSEESFAEIKSMINDESFAGDKLEIAKQATKSEHLTAEQIRDIAKLLQYESDRVEYLKFAYQYCFDKNKYYIVNQAFQYSSSKDELKEALGL